MNSTKLTVTLAIAAVLASVLPARAATFSSPLLTAIAPQSSQCRVSNVGKASINVTGTLYDGSGNVLAPTSNTCTNNGGVLAAGDTCILSYGAGAVRCVINASSSKLRAVLIIYDINGTIATVPVTKK